MRSAHTILQVDGERSVGNLKSHVVDADPERDQPRPGVEGPGDLAFEHVGAGGAALTEVQELERRVRRAELADQPLGIPAARLAPTPTAVESPSAT